MTQSKPLSDTDDKTKLSDKTLFKKVRSAMTRLSRQGVSQALILFYTLKSPDTPVWCKTVALSSLGYFISLIDAIPDLTPILGYTDDLSVMAAAIATISAHVTPKIRDQAKQKTDQLFDE